VLTAVFDASQAQVVGQNFFEGKAALCRMATRLEHDNIGAARRAMELDDRFLQRG
jgi:hypothetical protein